MDVPPGSRRFRFARLRGVRANYMVRFWIASLIGLAAIVDDLARRRISNWISLSALVAGLILQVWESGWRGGLSGLLGTLIGGGIFLIFYCMGGMGGGDIKLMAGFGAMLGANGILQASLWTAAVGGLMAVGFLLVGQLRSTRRRLLSGSGLVTQTEQKSMPYAPAIAAGVWLSLLAR